VKGLSDVSEGKAQLGLGHSYSRAKVKFNVNRADNMIIQAICLLDQLDKDVNTFSMRIRCVIVFFEDERLCWIYIIYVLKKTSVTLGVADDTGSRITT